MSMQPPPGQVGRGHPDTSADAAQQSAWSNLDHREQALVLLWRAGARGLTGAQIAAELGISTQIAGSRLIELRAEGCAAGKFPRLAYRTRDKRAIPGSRSGRIHYLNDQGITVAQRIAKTIGAAP